MPADRPGRTPVRCPDLDHDPVDPDRQPGDHGGPDIDYVVVESAKPTGGPSATSSREDAARHTPASSRRTAKLADQAVVRLKGATWSGSYTPPMTYLEGHANAFRVVEADFVTTEDGTGLVHTAGAFGEDDKVDHRPRGHRGGRPGRHRRAFTFPVTDYDRVHVFDANPPIIDHLKARTRLDAAAGREAGGPTEGTVLLAARPTSTPTRTAGAAAAADLHGGVELVRATYPQVPRPDAGAQPGDHLGARARQGRPVRQVAGEHPRLVDLPQPLLGQPDPGVEAPTTRSTRASTSTARWPSLEARLRRAARTSPTCTGPSSTS
jgi:hypothetical protein